MPHFIRQAIGTVISWFLKPVREEEQSRSRDLEARIRAEIFRSSSDLQG
jgi:hypothetical protein